MCSTVFRMMANSMLRSARTPTLSHRWATSCTSRTRCSCAMRSLRLSESASVLGRSVMNARSVRSPRTLIACAAWQTSTTSTSV